VRYAKGIGSGLAVGTAGAVGETFLLCSGPGAFACAIAPGIPATIATVTFLGSGFVGGRSAYNSIKEAEAICLDKKKSQK